MDRDQNKREACASCRYQHRRCPQDCLLAPYFPSDLPLDFIRNVYRVFPRSNIEKWIEDTPLDSRKDLMDAIKIEASTRASDPSLGICRPIFQLKTLIYDAKQELYHTCQQLAFHRRRVMSTNVHGQAAPPTNLQASMNVPPNPYGEGGHPLGFHNQFPTSWTSRRYQDQNNARFSLLGPVENQPNPTFSLVESVHDNAIASSTSLSQTPLSLSPFLASSSQPLQNLPIVQTFTLPNSSVDRGNIGERIAPSMIYDQPLNLFLASSSQPIQNQPIVQPFSFPDSLHHGNAVAPSLNPFDNIASSSQPFQNQPIVELSSSSGSEQDLDDEYLSFLEL